MAVRERCPSCGCFTYRISEGNSTCCNERCGDSWQAAKRDFDSSLLGAAVRQVIGEPNAR